MKNECRIILLFTLNPTTEKNKRQSNFRSQSAKIAQMVGISFGNVMTFEPTEHIQSILKTLPLKPGCYLMKDESGEIIYIGKAKRLRQRVRDVALRD